MGWGEELGLEVGGGFLLGGVFCLQWFLGGLGRFRELLGFFYPKSFAYRLQTLTQL